MKGKINLKTVIIFAILILVIVLSVLGVNTAKTFISGATAGYEPQSLKAVPNENGKTATISWTTDKSVKASVFYGTNRASLLLMAEDAQATDSHNILLSNLKSDTTYYYKIVVDTDNIFDNGGALYDFKTGGKVGDSLTPTPTLTISPTVTVKPSLTATPTAVPTTKVSSVTGTPSSNCNKTTDYNKDKVINSLDYISCLKGKITPVSSKITPTGTLTPTTVPTVAKCINIGDYNKDGVVNSLDRIKCLQDSKI